MMLNAFSKKRNEHVTFSNWRQSCFTVVLLFRGLSRNETGLFQQVDGEFAQLAQISGIHGMLNKAVTQL